MALFRENRKLSVDPRAPERSHLALVRLIPWLRPDARVDASVDARFYTSKPGQNPIEIRLTSTLFYLTWTLLIHGAVMRGLDIGPLLAPLVFVLAGLAAVILLVALLPVAELVTRLVRRLGWNPEGATIHSAVHQTVLMLVCLEAVFASHWVRWVGIFWITLVTLELAARVIEMILPESDGQSSES